MDKQSLQQKQEQSLPQDVQLHVHDNESFDNNYKKILEKKHLMAWQSDSTVAYKRPSEKHILRKKEKEKFFSPLSLITKTVNGKQEWNSKWN